MTISIDLGVYSVTAVLTAVKKQQVYADWSVQEKKQESLILAFSAVRSEGMSENQCVVFFQQQLTDEQIREKLERDFKPVRDLLVATALAPITKA